MILSPTFNYTPYYVHLDEAVAEEATEALAQAIIPDSVALTVASGHDTVN